MRLIDADELERSVMGCGEDVVCDDCAYEFINLIDAQSTIEAEPVRHVHWQMIIPAYIYECSACGQYVNTADISAYKFCHHCGAKMDEVSE